MSDKEKASLPPDTTTSTASQDDHPASERTSAIAAETSAIGPSALPPSALSELHSETQPQHQTHELQQQQTQQQPNQPEEQLHFLEQAAQPEAPFTLTSVAAGTLSPGGTAIRTLQPQLQTQQQHSTLIQGAATLATHATALETPGGGEISTPGVITRSSRSYAQSHPSSAPAPSFAPSAVAPLHTAMGNSQVGVDVEDSASAVTGMAVAIGASLPPAAALSPAVAHEGGGGIQCTKRPWTKEEDDLLLKLVKHYGSKDWTGICREIPGRNRKQCRERYKNHLEGNVKKGAWTQEEDNLIFEWQKKVGNKWSIISQHLPNRTDNAVKNRYWSATRSRERKAKKEAKKRAATATMGHQQEDKKMKAAATTSAGATQAPAIGFVGGIPQAHQPLPPTPTTPDVTSTTASVDATPISEIGLEQASQSAVTEDPEGDKKVKAKNKKGQFSV